MTRFAVVSRAREEAPGPNPNAARYAIEQLARRAQVDDATIQSWRVDDSDRDYLTVYLGAGTRKRVRFPRIRNGAWDQINRGIFHTSTAAWWPGANRNCEVIPDFKIPFSSSSQTHSGPLFIADAPESFTCAVDLPTSILLTLSRFEEMFPSPKDIHGRFPASASISWQNGFLHRPIVDEYGVAFEQVVRSLLPGWIPAERRLRVRISHDVDEIGLPFSFRSAVAKTFRYARPFETFRDLGAAIFGIHATSQVQLKQLVQLAAKRRLDIAVHWKCSECGPHDTGYDVHDRRISELMNELKSLGAEMGIHPSYVTFQSPKQLRGEVESLVALLGERSAGGRQDYLRWSPNTWVEWDKLGLAYDSSVGFADHVGFRAGTCVPYRPWLWSEQREAKLVEIPLLVMDSTLYGYMKLSANQALMVVKDIVDRCRAVGGVFTIAWHNTTLLRSGYSQIYRKILDEIAFSAKFDWRAASA